MKNKDTYDLSLSMVTFLGQAVNDNTEAGDFNSFLKIRRELNHFLLNLNQSSQSNAAGQQIHFLFVALEHLDNVDKEIRLADVPQEMISLERIHDKIRSLKILILNYIRHLTGER